MLIETYTATQNISNECWLWLNGTNRGNFTDCSTNSTELDADLQERRQKNAFLYIIVVLGFYSLGVLLLIVYYLKRERKDLEEEKMLEDYLQSKPLTASQERTRPTGRLLLSAFNTVHIVIQSENSAGKITFV